MEDKMERTRMTPPISKGPHRPRLSVEITEEQYRSLQRLVPWGLQRALFSVVIDFLIKLLEVTGPKVITSLVMGELKFSIKEAEDDD